MIRPAALLKSWFRKGAYPTAEQFADWLDSFFHKEEKIPIDSVDGLSGRINDKYDQTAGEDLEYEHGSLVARVTQNQTENDLAHSNISDRIGELQETDAGLRTDLAAAQETIAANTSAIETEAGRATAAEGNLGAGIEAIESKIPSTATPANKLADQAFVNSSIQRNIANRVSPTADGQTPWASRAAILNATAFYHGGEAYTPTDHDYATIGADESAPAPYTGGQTIVEFDGAAWSYAYGVNERPFTAAENAALASGVTEGKLAEIDTSLSGKVAKTATVDSSSAMLVYLYGSTDKEGTSPVMRAATTAALGPGIPLRTSTGNIAVVATAAEGNYAIGKQEAKALIAAKAALASPVFTGTPTAPTPAAADNSQKLATTAFVQVAIAALPVPANFRPRIALPDIPVGVNVRGWRMHVDSGILTANNMPATIIAFSAEGDSGVFRLVGRAQTSSVRVPSLISLAGLRQLFAPIGTGTELDDISTYIQNIHELFIPDTEDLIVATNNATRYANGQFLLWDWGFVFFEPKRGSVMSLYDIVPQNNPEGLDPTDLSGKTLVFNHRGAPPRAPEGANVDCQIRLSNGAELYIFIGSNDTDCLINYTDLSGNICENGVWNVRGFTFSANSVISGIVLNGEDVYTNPFANIDALTSDDSYKFIDAAIL